GGGGEEGGGAGDPDAAGGGEDGGGRARVGAGAGGPAAAAAVVACPHAQTRRIIRYSVTVTANEGRSNTCTPDAACPGAAARPAPQSAHAGGSTCTRRSGTATRCKPLPG